MANYCLVPMCSSTKLTTPTKLFFHMPNNAVLRKKWCLAMKRDPAKNKPLSAITHLYVCEDHFDLENDMQNYIRYKLQGGRISVKPGVLPHIFDCQKKEVKAPPPSRERLLKRKRKSIVGELLNFTTAVQPTAMTSATATDPPNDEDVSLAMSPAVCDKETSDCCFEPEVVIKEEPIDIVEDPAPSTTRLHHEFILPDTDSFQSCSMPTIKEAYTIVITEPVEEPLQITLNGRTTKPNKKKTYKKVNVVEQCENRSTEKDTGTTKSNSTKDPFNEYGEYIAAKLRNLDWKSCACVQKAFAKILFDAEMGKFK